MTTQADKSVEEMTHVDVAVQTMNIPSECSITISTTSLPEENIKIGTCPVRRNQTKKVPYRHPNHENRWINHATYRYHSNQKQQTDVPDNSDVTSIQSYANKSLLNSSDQNTIQKINLRWSDPFSVRQFCLSLRRSYQHVLTKMIVPRQKDIWSRKRDQAFFINKIWGQSFLRKKAMLRIKYI